MEIIKRSENEAGKVFFTMGALVVWIIVVYEMMN